MVFLAGVTLLAVIAADYWLASGEPLPTYPLIRHALGPLLAVRRQNWYIETTQLPHKQFAIVHVALAAAVLCLCCQQRCWILCRTQPQPSQLVVTLGWMIVALHSAKYAAEVLLTQLTHSMPWMAVHHAVAMGAFACAVWEPKCLSGLVVTLYLMHEVSGAWDINLNDPTMIVQLGTFIYHVLMFILLFWYLHCGAVQRIISLRVGLLVGVLMSTNFAAYCTEFTDSFCPVQYDSSLDAFYAFTEGRQPWLVKIRAGLIAFAVAIVGLTSVFAAACVAIKYVGKQSICQRCGSRKQLMQLICLQAICCGTRVAEVASKVQ
jgi:hypothetical protein